MSVLKNDWCPADGPQISLERMGGAEKLTVHDCKMHNKLQMNDEMIEKLNIASTFFFHFSISHVVDIGRADCNWPPGTNKVIGTSKLEEANQS